ncbi:acetyl-CoA carboxylase biotin carboxyl carrier protein, partial [Actinomadura sp. CNU-125]|uniref:acetyl-CoA carboxylase biotin carboxyl carrier protein n=1 Tax=Actinomadura sp. CNU-125 TaxID=1904961 RepID=UPI0029169110
RTGGRRERRRRGRGRRRRGSRGRCLLPPPGAGRREFVEVGQEIAAGQQVGILEAMKLMNPIESEEAGRVAEILVADETPVEYGQPLIRLAPLDDATAAADHDGP